MLARLRSVYVQLISARRTNDFALTVYWAAGQVIDCCTRGPEQLARGQADKSGAGPISETGRKMLTDLMREGLGDHVLLLRLYQVSYFIDQSATSAKVLQFQVEAAGTAQQCRRQPAAPSQVEVKSRMGNPLCPAGCGLPDYEYLVQSFMEVIQHGVICKTARVQR